jgi:hypothetical protein
VVIQFSLRSALMFFLPGQSRIDNAVPISQSRLRVIE